MVYQLMKLEQLPLLLILLMSSGLNSWSCGPVQKQRYDDGPNNKLYCFISVSETYMFAL